MNDGAASGSSTPDPAPTELLALAVRWARQAGELMLRRRAEGLSVDLKSSDTDVVTNVDRAVEEFLREQIFAARPQDSVLGEEGGGPAGDGAAGGSAVRWILDPIDGTVNFLLGLPQFAVSVAAELNGRVVAGCVYNPNSGDVFSAALGHGAYHGEQRLHGPRSVPLERAVVATGFGYDSGHRARQGEIVGALLARIGNLRRLGSAALDLAALAAGWVDMYYEGPLGEWDFAAGLLIATEAGVAVSGLHGRPAGPAFVAAAHPDHAGEFFAVLEDLGAAPVPDVLGGAVGLPSA